MKRASYMSKNELLDFLKIGVLAAEAENIGNRTPEKEWARKLKCAATYLSKIIDERLEALDFAQRATVLRRYHHSEMIMRTSDQRRLNKSQDGKPEENITVNTNDFYDVVDMALLSCMKCPQGECVVGGCRLRRVYHNLGVLPMRTNTNAGECEFRADNEVKCVTPQYQKIAERI